jgi:hypothetical protein
MHTTYSRNSDSTEDYSHPVQEKEASRDLTIRSSRLSCHRNGRHIRNTVAYVKNDKEKQINLTRKLAVE